MNNINWTQIIVAIVAVYGAILSTITFLYNQKEKIRNLNVVFSNGSIINSSDLGDIMLFITVLNSGSKSAIINVPRIILPDRKTIVFPNPQSNIRFPYKLEEGSKCMIWTDMKGLAKQLCANGYKGKIKLMADVEDGTEKKYVTKKAWRLNIDEWAK